MEHIKRGKLRLKNGSGMKISSKKSKKKMKKDRKQQNDKSSNHNTSNEMFTETNDVVENIELTPAQRRHEALRKQREEEEIAKLAGKTYRERVEDLNQYLGSLTEHHDVPRVSAAGNG